MRKHRDLFRSDASPQAEDVASCRPVRFRQPWLHGLGLLPAAVTLVWILVMTGCAAQPPMAGGPATTAVQDETMVSDEAGTQCEYEEEPMPGAAIEVEHGVVIRIVYDNTKARSDLVADWGFACVVEVGGHTILFDTGASGTTLLDNMQKMDLDPRKVEAVVLSHDHHDHTGGLEAFLHVNSSVTVFVPESLGEARRRAIVESGAILRVVGAARALFDDVFSTGELPGSPPEQSLVVAIERGCVVITGCAHPGIVRIVEAAQQQFGNNVSVVIGGFHMGGLSPAEISEVVEELKCLGVETVCPVHCTGERAIALFADAYGDEYVRGGAGQVIVFP